MKLYRSTRLRKNLRSVKEDEVMTTIQQGRTELELPCTLTDEEVQSRGRMLCETIWVIDEVQKARTEAMKG